MTCRDLPRVGILSYITRYPNKWTAENHVIHMDVSTYTYTCIYIYISVMSLSLSLYIYIYMTVYMYIQSCIHVYIYTKCIYPGAKLRLLGRGHRLRCHESAFTQNRIDTAKGFGLGLVVR